jgi:ribosome-binding protein aMBF1 (putative translation factor)
MARCEVCGNEYDKSFEIVAARNRHVFDSCASCARQAGVRDVRDRAA